MQTCCSFLAYIFWFFQYKVSNLFMYPIPRASSWGRWEAWVWPDERFHFISSAFHIWAGLATAECVTPWQAPCCAASFWWCWPGSVLPSCGCSETESTAILRYPWGYGLFVFQIRNTKLWTSLKTNPNNLHSVKIDQVCLLCPGLIYYSLNSFYFSRMWRTSHVWRLLQL